MHVVQYLGQGRHSAHGYNNTGDSSIKIHELTGHLTLHVLRKSTLSRVSIRCQELKHRNGNPRRKVTVLKQVLPQNIIVHSWNRGLGNTC